MNHEIDNAPRFNDPILEREWLAQENAIRRERLHLGSSGDNARSQHYRLLARVLLTAPLDALPVDFAQQVSALAAARAHDRTPAMTLERLMTTALASALLVAAVAATATYGATWWPSFEALVPAPPTAQWLLALIGCLGASGLLETWSRRVRPTDRVSKGAM